MVVIRENVIKGQTDELRLTDELRTHRLITVWVVMMMMLAYLYA